MVEVVTRSELRALLPVLQRFTDRARRSMDDRLRRLEESDDPLDEDLTLAAIEAIVERWREDMVLLGGAPTGLWQVEFRSAGGWYVWECGDTEVVGIRSHAMEPRASLH